MSEFKSGSSEPYVLHFASTTNAFDGLITRLIAAKSKCGKQVAMTEKELTILCNATRNVLLAQPCLIEIDGPIKICGDIHGQFFDLISIFEMCGYPDKVSYLFLGDYVDRGKQSLETIALLFAYKNKYPDTFFLLRGNHECKNVSYIYGFFDECKRRFDTKLWKTFTDVFECLPVAGIIQEQIFCCHGGLSMDFFTSDFAPVPRMKKKRKTTICGKDSHFNSTMTTEEVDITACAEEPQQQLSQEEIQQIQKNNLTKLKNKINAIDRPAIIPPDGVLCDLLWADPMDDVQEEIDEKTKSRRRQSNLQQSDGLPRGWGINERGASVTFSKLIIYKFINTFNLDLIIRAHQVVQEGFEFKANRKLITVFSAPNYCGEFNNEAAVVKLDKKEVLENGTLIINLVGSFEKVKSYSMQVTSPKDVPVNAKSRSSITSFIN